MGLNAKIVCAEHARHRNEHRDEQQYEQLEQRHQLHEEKRMANAWNREKLGEEAAKVPPNMLSVKNTRLYVRHNILLRDGINHP